MAQTLSKPESVTVGSVTLKIYPVQRPNRTVYNVTYYSQGKRSIRQFSDLEKARDEAFTLAGKINSGAVQAVNLTNEQASIYTLACKAAEATGRRLDQIAEEYAYCWQILGRKDLLKTAAEFYRDRVLKIKQSTVPQIYKEFQTRKEGKSDHYRKDIEVRLGRFAETFGGYIHNITATDITAWLDGLSGSLRNKDNHRRLISTLFSYAQRQGYLPEGRTEAEKVELLVGDDEGEVVIFTPDELSKLLLHGDEEVRKYLVLGAFAGLRTQEIKRLEWSDIALPEKYLVISKGKSKTKTRRIVYGRENLWVWLETFKKGKGPVVDRLRPEKTAAEIAGTLAGVKWKRNGLRHSFASYLYALTNDENLVCSQTGHDPRTFRRHYFNAQLKTAAEAWFSITPDILEDTDEK